MAVGGPRLSHWNGSSPHHVRAYDKDAHAEQTQRCEGHRKRLREPGVVVGRLTCHVTSAREVGDATPRRMVLTAGLGIGIAWLRGNHLLKPDSVD